MGDLLKTVPAAPAATLVLAAPSLVVSRCDHFILEEGHIGGGKP